VEKIVERFPEISAALPVFLLANLSRVLVQATTPYLSMPACRKSRSPAWQLLRSRIDLFPALSHIFS
jgi:hypothetical protein